MEELLSKYLQKFKHLRLDRSHGVAPHKPILMISILQLIRNGFITENKIYLSPELVALFKSNWSTLVTTNHDCRISYPFYYLKSDKFWTLIPRRAFDDVTKLGSLVKSFSNLNAAIEFATINTELWTLMCDIRANGILLHFLLDEYFPKTKNHFNSSSGNQKEIFGDLENKILKEDPEAYRLEIKQLITEHNEEEIFIRGGVFKREVPRIYNYTCCISGLKIESTHNVSMIDACHIVPFSVSFDDTVTNGIALCPNLHRAFDRGLIAIDENYKVNVSKSFKEDKTSYSIRAFENKIINLPTIESYFPTADNFLWHLKNTFKK